MDQAGQQSALLQYLELEKYASSPRAAAELITKATSDPNTYVFAELLAKKNIDSLKEDSQYASQYKLLEIFCWGTWETYRAADSLPKLTDAQALKLRLLSLITYASEKNGDLAYSTLCKRLDFDNTIDLEHLVTTALYSNLLTATLNPAEQTVLITSVAPLRDLAPGSVKSMLAELEAWSARCEGVVAELDAEIARIKTEASKKAASQAKTDKHFKTALESEKLVPRPTRSAKREAVATPDEDLDDEDPMDIDGQNTGARKKSGGLLEKMRAKS